MGLVVMLLACAEAPRPVRTKTRWPVEEAAFTVRVVDPAGQPVPGVKLVARRADHGSLVSRSGTSDATGTVRLHVMPGWYVVQAEAPGFVNLLHPDARIAPGAETRLELTLMRAVPFAGRVVDLEGRPVAGARLRLTPSGDGDSSLRSESDAEGRFHFDNVPAGAVKLRAEKDGWSPTRLELSTPQTELTVVMGGLGSLRVRVLGPDGRPSPEGSASLSSMDEARPLALSPERTPEATLFQELPAGRYRVTGRYAPAQDCWWDRSVEVQVAPGARAEATVSFEGSQGLGTWRARAVDAMGQGLGGATGMLWTWNASQSELEAYGGCHFQTGRDGEFVIQGLLEAPSTMSLTVPNRRLDWKSQGPPPPGTGEALVFREAFGGLEGRVVRPDGVPVGYFEIDGHSQHGREGSYLYSVSMTHVYQWVIEVLGFAPALVRAEGRDGELLKVPDVILDVGRTVHGRVVAEDGSTGIPMQEVELVEVFDLEGHGGRHPWTARTDADGYFRFEHVASRRQFLRVDAKARGTVLRELGPDEESVKLRLVPGVELEGAVTDGARVPLVRVNLKVRCEGGFRVSAESDIAGNYAAHIPGNRSCFVHAEGSPLNVPVPRPPPMSFSPKLIRLAPATHHRLDLVPRQGPALLRVSVNASREFVTAFVLPGEVPWPRSPRALDAAIRAGFGPEPMPEAWTSEDGDSLIAPNFLVGADFDFGHLPLGHYTLFIREEMDGADGLLRIPVDLSRAGVHVVDSERPAQGGGRPYMR
ncbi:carboxypeptidase regulatory-like domain-containing protein [Corallococcus sp. 4LFB]|uniref:carboxypeptidase regulatory-like domain-containing protein n=1 Tax=Corallococcus sp. 4LFB TaxID=3383249 RepID=UPI0039749F6F